MSEQSVTSKGLQIECSSCSLLILTSLRWQLLNVYTMRATVYPQRYKRWVKFSTWESVDETNYRICDDGENYKMLL